METRLARVVLVSLLVMISLGASGCPGFSCSIPTTSTTARTAAPVSTTTTAAPTTTTSSSTTTSTTSTTLSALERYRAAMRVWVDTYGAGLSQAYSVISGANLLNPTPAQIQATKDLDLLMSRMIPDLRAISPPPELAQAHAGFLGSLERMAAGVHDLSAALEQGRGFNALAAAAAIGAAWQEGSADRSTLEQALGFSLSG